MTTKLQFTDNPAGIYVEIPGDETLYLQGDDGQLRKASPEETRRLRDIWAGLLKPGGEI